MLPGVSEIILVDKDNEKIANRYIFNKGDTTFPIYAKLDKIKYEPFESMTISFSLKCENDCPITEPFSLSIRDGSNEVKWNRNIMTDLLLMSDIKGYVSNPSYYFESDDDKHRVDLDLLLMVQGWQKLSYDKIKSTKEDNLRYKPETNGITVDGTVSYYNVKKPKEGIDVSMLMLNQAQEKGENDGRVFFENKFVTDSLGRFHFVADVAGDWDMILAASKNLKRQNLTITLDNQFSPIPRSYEPYELFLEKIFQKESDSLTNNQESSDSDNVETISYDRDSILMMDNLHNEKSIMLKEIEVKGKNSSKANDIYRARANSIAYYDFKENADRLYDEGFYYCDDVDEFLRKVNPNFYPYIQGNFKCLLYQDKIPLVVIDYEGTDVQYEFRYKELPVEWIKSVYISENENLIKKYCDPKLTKEVALKHYGCVVFIETYPEEDRPAAATWGVRKTTFHGYDSASEFYNPDYSCYQPYEDDYRRTLYWNPMVIPDEKGNVQIKIFNNESCQYPIIDAQTVTSSGLIGLSEY